ncbi:hypothetical protein BFS35_011105 [Macrococcoides goetzii]|uniref:Uncharacterized protein n=1 Tax=Macrococcoides goetzii TaxID=1891097 RepID=A0A2G5NW34_9STAP|nr:hypothetical protein [Macrococcus goetzii]RAI79686.1 hypothetical protein BFS35_011105 [Macrococcus goetzii]
MKIKQRKYMSEKEALHWLVDNVEVVDGIDVGCNEYVEGFFECQFKYDERLGWTKDGRFYIEEQVEITEETEMKRLVCVHSHTNNISCYNDVSIEKALHLASFDKCTFKKIYLQNPDGSICELIWSKERGLID